VIHYSLRCDNGHSFDAWFKNAETFDRQHSAGSISCPTCNSEQVEKAPMAPAVARSGSEKVTLSAGHPQHAEILELMRAMRRKVTTEADYVGDKFAEEARKIHFHEADPRGIYGEATRDEVASLLEDGVDFLPLPNVPEEQN
jgi:hypothetical protein